MTLLDDIEPWVVGHYNGYVSLLCPFHDDETPSLLAYESGRFKCKACGERGQIPYLIAKLQGVDPDTVKKVEPRRSIFLPPWENSAAIEQLIGDANYVLLHNKSSQDWLKQRGVASMIEPANLGIYEGWYTIPVYDFTDGLLIGLMLRAGPSIEGEQRFIHPDGMTSVLYTPVRQAKHEEKLFVVFGMFDALTLAALGYSVVTPTMGKDSLRAPWLEDFRKPIIILPDQGEEESAEKLAAHLDWRGRVWRLLYPEGIKDPNDFLWKGQKKQLVRQLDYILAH